MIIPTVIKRISPTIKYMMNPCAVKSSILSIIIFPCSKNISFPFFSMNLSDDLLISNGNALCPNETTTLTAIEEPAGENYTYTWFQNSIPQPTPSPENEFVVTQEGTYSVEVMLDANCTLSGEATIEYFTQPNANNATLEACDSNNDGIEEFDLTQAEQDIS